MQRRLVTMGVQAPFDDTVGILAAATGVAIPKRGAEQVVIDARVDFDACYVHRAQAATDDEAQQADGTILLGAVDGKGIPMVKPEPAVKTARLEMGEKRHNKKIATMGSVHPPAHHRSPDEVVTSLFALSEREHPPDDTHDAKRRCGPEHERVWASLQSYKDTSITDARTEMRRRDPAYERDWVIVTDSEGALQRRVGTRALDS